jgi:hypothetical protein
MFVAVLMTMSVQIDFGNAMSLQDAAVYFDDYEVSTVYYRAPEVIFLDFGA